MSLVVLQTLLLILALVALLLVLASGAATRQIRGVAQAEARPDERRAAARAHGARGPGRQENPS